MTSTAPPSVSTLSPADRLEVEFKGRKASHQKRAHLLPRLKTLRTFELVAGLKASKRKQLALKF